MATVDDDPLSIVRRYPEHGVVRFSHFLRARSLSDYAAVPRLWGISVLDDQAAAGAIMWVPGSVIFLIPVAVLAIRLLDSPRTRSTTNKIGYKIVKVE